MGRSAEYNYCGPCRKAPGFALPSIVNGIPSTARNASASSGTIISPVAQLLNEKRPGSFPNASCLACGFGNRIKITHGLCRVGFSFFNQKQEVAGEQKKYDAARLCWFEFFALTVTSRGWKKTDTAGNHVGCIACPTTAHQPTKRIAAARYPRGGPPGRSNKCVELRRFRALFIL